MSSIYREYLATAQSAKLPLLLTAPTWRLDPIRVAAAGAPAAGVPETINSDAVAYLTGVRDAYASSEPVLVGALIGPQSDCYRPDLAPTTDAATAFHTEQITELATTGADFLLAQTLPSVPEALGIARAMSVTGKPFIISFCTGPDGHVLDGTPLPQAIATIDAETPPTGYFVNCTHPQFLLDAYRPGDLHRLIGIQANGSSKDVTALEASATTQADPIPEWAAAMHRLHHEHQVQILGGCCGTTTAHMEALAAHKS